MIKFLKSFLASLGLILLCLFAHFFSTKYIPNILYFVNGIFIAFFLLHLEKLKNSTCITMCLLEIVCLAGVLFLINYSTFLQSFPSLLYFFQFNQSHFFLLLGNITVILFTKIYHF